MAAILIDGYNLIGIMHPDLQAERNRLIEALSLYRKITGHEITLVFDGWKDGPGSETRQRTGGITVVYSALGERADAAIKRMVEAGREFIVVSSDRDIQRHVWSRGSTPVESGDFLRALERRTTQGESGEPEQAPARRDGRGGRLSKKAKALQRALNKL